CWRFEIASGNASTLSFKNMERLFQIASGPWVIRSAGFAISVAVTLSFLHAELSLRQAQTLRGITAVELTEGSLHKLHHYFAEPTLVDIYWIQTVLVNSEFKRVGLTPPRNLIVRGSNLAQMDPLFISTYEWIPAAYL